MSFWFIHNFGKMQRGIFPQFKINELKIFPIKNTSKENENKLGLIVDDYLQYLQKNINDTNVNIIKNYESKIDVYVYKLYDLTFSEVKTIAPEFSLSEEEYNNFRT